ncbi:MBL fold metallo-hydrolase [bacterium c-19]|nr:MBL fold metallo-hydrolase [bacterium c-19]
MMKIDSLVLGSFAANCYLLWKNQHVLIVDPGSKSPKVQKLIDAQRGFVDGIYLTHGHFDHIAGVDSLANYYNCSVYMNPLDIPLLANPYLNVSAGMEHEVIVRSEIIALQPGINQIGEFAFELIDAPGHSEGSSIMLWEGNMICGDVLFKGSIGRTDLFTGSNTKMIQTLEKIKQMEPNLKVYPGHGPTTTLQEELLHNPYLN